MDCIFQETRFYVYCGTLALLSIVSLSIFLVQFITVFCLLSRCRPSLVPERQGMKRMGSEAPLLHPVESMEQDFEDLRNVSFIRSEMDKNAIEAIYGPNEIAEASLSVERSVQGEVRLESRRSRPGPGKVTDAAAVFENETAVQRRPVQKSAKFETDRKKIKLLSQNFHEGSQIPSGLVAKPEKEEPVEPPPEERVKKSQPKKAPVPRRHKDPPSVFKMRKERDDFLDDEFADLVEQTNQRLAEYTLAGVVPGEVSIFANQRITEKHINKSKFEFNQAALNQQKPEAHTRKVSDQKNLLLMAQSVCDDFDTDILGKKSLDTSLLSVATRATDITAVSREHVYS